MANRFASQILLYFVRFDLMHPGLVQLSIILRWERLIALITVVDKGARVVNALYVVPHMSLPVVAKLMAQATPVSFVPFEKFNHELQKFTRVLEGA